ncbi:MAG TPA: hypothetical protein VD978_24415 [Azospirillum sp.]|nr:hypothetical protein [Azospirillum sp.]
MQYEINCLAQPGPDGSEEVTLKYLVEATQMLERFLTSSNISGTLELIDLRRGKIVYKAYCLPNEITKP